MKAAFKGVLQAPKKLTPKQVEELKQQAEKKAEEEYTIRKKVERS